jgi:site-specific recombinase XerD
MKIKLVHNRRGLKRPASVEIYVYFNRKDKTYISTGVIIEAECWKNNMVVRHPRAPALNMSIRQIMERIYDYERIHLAEGKPVSSESLKRYISGKGSLQLFNDYMREELQKDMRRLAPGTYTSHLSILNRLDKFEKIAMNAFTLETVNRYHHYLLNFMLESTTPKSHKTVRKYVLRAVNTGLMRENPYRLFKVPAERSRRIHLSQQELEKLRQYKGIPRLEKVKDMFLFQCLSGLAYVDMQNLVKSDLFEHAGMPYIQKYRQKTDRTPQMIPLLDEALEIIQRHADPEDPHIFPKISNQKMNAYLMEIGTIQGIEKKLTTHVARHTFAVLMLEKGLPLETVSHILGHSSTKITSIYARVLVSKIQNDYKRLDINSL